MSTVRLCDRCKDDIPAYEPLAAFDWVLNGVANPMPRLRLELCLCCVKFLDQYMRAIKQ